MQDFGVIAMGFFSEALKFPAIIVLFFLSSNFGNSSRISLFLFFHVVGATPWEYIDVNYGEIINIQFDDSLFLVH